MSDIFNNIFKNEKNKMIFISCIIFFIAILSISNTGMWYDEICRVFDPITGNLANTIKTSLSFAQPGYMLFMHLWERITFGTQIEFFIRCSNLVFVPIAIFYAYKIAKAKKWSLWTILLFFIHPIFVYYMNEATPYIIVYALSLAYTYYVFFSEDFNSTKNIFIINLIYLLGVFVHFMFGFIIIPYIVMCLLTNYKDKKMIFKHIKILLLFSIIYLPLLILYLLNLVHVTTGFSIKNPAYVLYGFIGMAGIGLSRNDLRAFKLSKITGPQIIALVLMSIACISLLYFIIKKLKTILKEEKNYLICLLSFFVIVFTIAFIIQFGMWERHCLTIFPLFMVIFIDTLYLIKDKKSSLWLLLYIAIIIFSSINIRYNYYYQCDDYKGVYNYIKESNIDSYYLLSNFSIKLYNVESLVPEQYYIDGTSLEDQDIIDEFSNREKIILILFEKCSSKKLYDYFDNNDSYNVNSNYNSFKIITHTHN